MKTEWIKQSTPAKNLILYFAGWGSPATSVAHLALPPDYDLLICYDYRHFQLDQDLSAYQNIQVVAWSLGVWVAERVLEKLATESLNRDKSAVFFSKIFSATAINGTGLPCHAELGISPEIFQGTLTGLNPESRQKFERRMCGSKTLLNQYQHLEFQRDLENIRAELAWLYQQIQRDQRCDLIRWNKAIISQQDRIFPAENQQAFWQERCQIVQQAGSHYALADFNHWTEFWLDDDK